MYINGVDIFLRKLNNLDYMLWYFVCSWYQNWSGSSRYMMIKAIPIEKLLLGSDQLTFYTKTDKVNISCDRSQMMQLEQL